MTGAEEPCPVCAATGGTFFTRQRSFDWFACAGCGSKYLAPRPSAQELHRAYQQYLPQSPGEIGEWRRLMKDVFRQALELLGRPRGDARDLLDVGCAFGFFVEAAEQIGWRARGIDVSFDAVAAGKARGLPIDIGSVEEADFAPESFDAITLFYVLEHVREPRHTVERVFRWLKPGGRLMLRVPHSAPIVSLLSALGVSNTLLDPPHHLQDFSPRGLRSLLEGAGFQQVAMFPGASTRPSGVGSLVVTKVAGSLANALCRWTGGKLLVPGVSKTTTARKQAD